MNGSGGADKAERRGAPGVIRPPGRQAQPCPRNRGQRANTLDEGRNTKFYWREAGAISQQDDAVDRRRSMFVDEALKGRMKSGKSKAR
jgi:hypothetical protein